MDVLQSGVPHGKPSPETPPGPTSPNYRPRRNGLLPMNVSSQLMPLLPPESGVSSTRRTPGDNSPSFADCCSVRNLLMHCGLSSTPGQPTLDVALDMQTCPAQLGLTWSIFSFPLRICLPTLVSLMPTIEHPQAATSMMYPHRCLPGEYPYPG